MEKESHVVSDQQNFPKGQPHVSILTQAEGLPELIKDFLVPPKHLLNGLKAVLRNESASFS